MKTIEVGSTVAYAAKFLRSIGEFTGDMPAVRGKVTALQPVGASLVLAVIDWGIGSELPTKVNTKNLVLVSDNGMVHDVD